MKPINSLKELSKPLENIMGVDEAATLWNLSAGTIKNYCAEGRILGKKIGKTWIIDKTQPNPSKRTVKGNPIRKDIGNSVNLETQLEQSKLY